MVAAYVFGKLWALLVQAYPTDGEGSNSNSRRLSSGARRVQPYNS